MDNASLSTDDRRTGSSRGVDTTAWTAPPRTSPVPCSTGTARTFADEAGIGLADQPAPLFQLLVLAQLLSARIGAGIAVAAAGELTRGRLDDAAADARRAPLRASSPPSAGPATAATTSAPPRSCGRWPRSSSTGTAATCARLAAAADGDVGRAAAAGPGGQGHRADRRRRLPARGPGASGRGCARTSTTGRGRARAGVGLPDDDDRLADLVAARRPGALRRRRWCASPGCPAGPGPARSD